MHFSRTSAHEWKGREGGWGDKTIYCRSYNRKVNHHDRWAGETYSGIRKHKEAPGLPGRATQLRCWSLGLFPSKSSSTLLKWMARTQRSQQHSICIPVLPFLPVPKLLNPWAFLMGLALGKLLEMRCGSQSSNYSSNPGRAALRTNFWLASDCINFCSVL